MAGMIGFSYDDEALRRIAKADSPMLKAATKLAERAIVMVEGHVDVATFAAPPTPKIIEVGRKIEWQPMEGHSFPQRFEALVEVHTNDGSTLHHRINNVQGAPDRPVLEPRSLRNSAPMPAGRWRMGPSRRFFR